MKLDSSLPFSQKPATGTYPKPDKFSLHFYINSLSSILVSLKVAFCLVTPYNILSECERFERAHVFNFQP